MNVKNATVKSSLTTLAKRGYIDYLHFDFERVDINHYLTMLNSTYAIERSLAAKGLRKHVLKAKVSEALLNAFTTETALYTKIEIAKTLKSGNKKTLQAMLPYLAKIPNNQYEILPAQVSKKKSYPLPRDMIARTIAHMNPIYLPYLIDYLLTCECKQARELIDAIGFMAYRNQCKSAKLFATLKQYFESSKDEIIRWKMITCFSAFLPYSKDDLIYLSNEDDLLGKEAVRSLSFLNKK
ncbi:MAG: hypothetical protein EOM50_16235 [Erysipelotrichia bacterium]|nr:hypothetical protein [Erysipelotrichia bacterium]NCC54977.1 hypothetical protein [Erysipelotrichia bacterium]